jgi:lipid-A-disaccharide synthase
VANISSFSFDNTHSLNFMDTSKLGKRIMIVAGEASGDLHGANLAKEIQAVAPQISLYGMGGKSMASAGVEIVQDISSMAVMGLVEVLSRLMDIRRAMHKLTDQFTNRPPDLLVLIDYPGFNLLLAKKAKRFNIPVLYYISPKVWAWREGRIKQIKRYVDRLAVILPFEKEYFLQHGISADYVGNPLLDSVQTKHSKKEFLEQHNIDPTSTIVGLMPGSRRTEISRLLPLFLQVAGKLSSAIKNTVFLLPLAPTLTINDLEKSGLQDSNVDLRIITEDHYDLMAVCDAAMAASGTLTLELAILNVPMLVSYRVAPLSYLLGKHFIKVKFASLVNLIAGTEVVRELLQNEATPDNIFQEMLRLLKDTETRRQMKQQLADVIGQLGEPGASKRTAKLALDMVTETRGIDD